MKKICYSTIVMLAMMVAALSFSACKDDDEDKNAEDVAVENACEALEQVSDIYMECHSISDLKERADEISMIEDVEDVYFTDIAMFVKVKDFMTVSYCFFPEEKIAPIDVSDFELNNQAKTRAGTDKVFSQLGLETAVIVDQQLDRNWESYKNYVKATLKAGGIETTFNNEPTLSFFEDELFDYDIVLFINHGCYDPVTKLHWLCLSNEELFDQSDYRGEKIWDNLQKKYKTNWYYKDYLRDEQLRIFITQKEIGGEKSQMAHFFLSEKFLTAKEKKFKKEGKAIVFSVACQSLKGGAPPADGSTEDKNKRNYDFAKAFIARGAGVYFGYDETNGAGQRGGVLFMGGLASGQSVMSAYNSLPDDVRHDKRSRDNRSWTADLLHYPLNHFEIENSCQVFPTLKEKGETDTGFTLNASEPYAIVCFETKNKERKWSKVYNTDFVYGFELSTTDDFAKPIDYVGLKLNKNTKIQNNTVSFSYTVPKKDLESETTYYYRAYLYDGTNRYYSDSDYFTTPKQERIDQVIPEEIRKQMEPYIPIYDGNNPPVVEGVYVMSPTNITFDSTNQFKVGTQFSDYYWTFSGQDYFKNTLDFEGKEVSNGRTYTHSKGPGAFISGSGDNFSVFFNITGTSYHEQYNIDFREALIISGTMTSGGVKDVYYSLVLISKSDDPKPYLIKEKSFRVFKDGDGLAKTATWPSSVRSSGYEVNEGELFTPWSVYAKRGSGSK